MKKFKFNYLYLFPITAGVLSAFAFTFQNLWWLNFFSIMPLFYVSKNTDSKKRLFIYILVYSLFYYSTLLFWLYEAKAFLPFGGCSIAFITGGIIILALLEGVYSGLAVCVFAGLRKNAISDMIIFPMLFILGEWVQEKTPILPFPWGRIGISMTKFLPFIQSASLFGSLFTSFLVVLINCILLTMITNIKKPAVLKPAATILMVFFIGNLTYGMFRLNVISGHTETFEVVLVQGNFPQDSKWSANTDEILKRYINLTDEAVTPETKLVLWPETAIPLYLEDNLDEKRDLLKLAKEKNVTIITGVKNKTFEPESTYNSMVAISPEGDISEPYNKQILVPFGERLPLERLLKSIPKVFDGFNSFCAGDDSTPIKTDIGKVGGAICYESVFPGVTRKAVQKGAEIIAVLSNDSWFGSSPALYQHRSHAVMRAVENKRYVLRASNTGITSVISPYGELCASAAPFVDTALSFNVSSEKGRTVYSYFGDVFAAISVVIYLAALMDSLKSCYKKRHPSR